MIYFDFSGYADMAVGLALMFGIKLKINFFSPYKSRNLIEFWRKWHITLSSFLKDHLYIPLGGNKHGLVIQIYSLMLTMILGGIWHGAGWNFLLWGLVHGIGLVFLHFVFYFSKKTYILPQSLSIIVTFVFVSLLWVFFRMDFDNSITFFISLLDFDFSNTNLTDISTLLIIFCFFIVWFLPNSMQLINLEKEKFGIKKWYVVLSALCMFISLKFMASAPSLSFVYFNF
jgi:D-alanyl-lipoteichoic acid acyltransferase DltB (MBOAT superfamily)